MPMLMASRASPPGAPEPQKANPDLGVSSIKPDDSDCEVDCSEEISGSFVAAGGNSSELFEMCVASLMANFRTLARNDH